MPKLTPLQVLLRSNAVPTSQVIAATGRNRSTVWRWQNGLSFPARPDVERLIALYGPERLDFNGCYVPTVEATSE